MKINYLLPLLFCGFFLPMLGSAMGDTKNNEEEACFAVSWTGAGAQVWWVESPEKLQSVFRRQQNAKSPRGKIKRVIKSPAAALNEAFARLVPLKGKRLSEIYRQKNQLEAINQILDVIKTGSWARYRFYLDEKFDTCEVMRCLYLDSHMSSKVQLY